MTSWLDRLVLAEEEDEEEEEEEEEDDTPTAYSQGMQDDGHLHRQKRAYRHDHYDYRGHGGRHTPSYSGPYAEREAGVRTRSPPASYHSRSSSRSPSPRRRAIVPVHSNSRDGDRYRGRDRIGYDRHDRHERRITRQEGYGDVHTRKASPHGRSAAGRSDSHSRRRPPLKRGPSSSSSASNNSSSSMSAWESAARNALRAGTMAALSSHSAPGSWLGHKGTRVATAALGAALVDTYMGHRHPESVNGVRHTAMRQAAEYAINSIVAEPILQRAARRRTRR
ncbi:hypothetical protein SCUCBS95973_003468 [Sporothrix curviconia]|uniref:Uncharacterized protein n=1 Tax=Sporothrix curviconia TaxID=1260050 RepID=A0ABP0BFM8_9PEZI